VFENSPSDVEEAEITNDELGIVSVTANKLSVLGKGWFICCSKNMNCRQEKIGKEGDEGHIRKCDCSEVVGACKVDQDIVRRTE